MQNSGIKNLLIMLGDDLSPKKEEFSSKELNAGKLIFKLRGPTLKKRIKYTREFFDWNALKRIIEISPSADGTGTFIMDLFTLLDMHIQSGQGIYTIDHENKNEIEQESDPYFVVNYRLRPARNCLIMLINLQFHYAYIDIIGNEKGRSEINRYIQFTKILASLMVEEGVELQREYKHIDRAFYLFSYGIISMNFDPLLLWFLFNSHNESNNPKESVPTDRFKLFHDFGYPLGIRNIDGNDPSIKYPINEYVAQRLNKLEKNPYRIGKYYFAHGSTNWRECPNCGKVTVHLGDHWEYFSESLFPRSLILLC